MSELKEVLDNMATKTKDEQLADELGVHADELEQKGYAEAAEWIRLNLHAPLIELRGKIRFRLGGKELTAQLLAAEQSNGSSTGQFSPVLTLQAAVTKIEERLPTE